MSLTQQFLILTTLPLSFLGMVLYLWRSGLRRHELRQRWTIALLMAAVWASSVLRFFGGTSFSPALVQTWNVIGKYAFSGMAMFVLLTTFSHLSIPRQHGRFALGLSGFLLALALLLDGNIWPYQIPDFVIAGQTVRHFDLSMSVWIASWLVPAVAAMMLTQQVMATFPNSLYRNQMHFWLLVLSLLIIGGGLASIQQPDQPAWQEAGLLIVIMAALTGTISIAHSHLPDLQVALRWLLGRLSGTLIIFGLTWIALSRIVRGVTTLPTDTSPNLVLFLAAALFAGFFTLIYRMVNEATRRLFLPTAARHEAALADYDNATGNWSNPAQLAQLFLRVVQSALGTEDAWFFTVENGPAAQMILRPLASLGNYPLETAAFSGDSLFAAYLRQNRMPLVQFDIDTLSSFDEMPPDEKAQLADWKRILYMPMHAGNNLVGVLALGEKSTGVSYDRKDFEQLKSLAFRFSPFLAQAQDMASLRQVNDYVFAQNQLLTYQKQHLQEWLNLHVQFTQLISPELRQPFISISQEIEDLQEYLASHEAGRQLSEELARQIESLQAALERLIIIAGRLQAREDIDFQPANLDNIARQAIRSLKTMAKARRVQVDYEPATALPCVLGDADQLQEAVQHLLHNAIKFNKIGGQVHLNYALKGDHICLHMRDTGVGIPEDRLSTIWQGLSQLRTNGQNRSAGLGLPLTRYIIAAHGGRVEVESKYGSGSTFSIYLPVALEAENVNRQT